MSKNTAVITAVEGYVPDYILTNEELSQMVDTNDEWIRTRTGIHQRHILKGEGLGTSDMAAVAVGQLLESRQLAPDDIDLLICATVTPDKQFPATANIICHKVGIKNKPSFDIAAACSGFLYALTTASKFIESGTYQRVIVVGADKMSSIMDYEDRATCVLFGDGAAAVLLEPKATAEAQNIGILDCILTSDGEGMQYLHQKAGGSVKPASHATVDAGEHYVYQDGRTVYKFAVKNMADIVIEIMQKNQLTSDSLNWLVPHQANKRIIDATGRRANIPPEKVMLNIHKYGNTTAATIPLCLWEWQDRLRKGDNIVLTAFGGGFTWGAIYLKWGYDTKS